VELSKIITKWWTQEKILDEDYFNAVGFLSTGNSLFSHMTPEIITADTSFDYDSSVMERLLSQDSEEFTSNLLSRLLSRIPKNLLSNDELLFDEDQPRGLSTWFKTTAKWWVDGEISDEEFKKNVNFLRNEGLLRSR